MDYPGESGLLEWPMSVLAEALSPKAALLIALFSMFLSATTMATEEAEYTVLLKEDNLEVRQLSLIHI